VPDYSLGTLGTVPRDYQSEEIPEKKHFAWCTPFLIFMKQKMTK
jgi:hypothetical protein